MAVDKNMPILIVDDYKTMLRIIRNLLRQLGFNNVDDAMDGSDALSKLRSKDYSLVISDWNMEPMTGIELLREVRQDNTLKDIPFIMITAESKTENVIAAKESGVNNYIVKPFNAATQGETNQCSWCVLIYRSISVARRYCQRLVFMRDTTNRVFYLKMQSIFVSCVANSFLYVEVSLKKAISGFTPNSPDNPWISPKRAYSISWFALFIAGFFYSAQCAFCF